MLEEGRKKERQGGGKREGGMNESWQERRKGRKDGRRMDSILSNGFKIIKSGNLPNGMQQVEKHLINLIKEKSNKSL